MTGDRQKAAVSQTRLGEAQLPAWTRTEAGKKLLAHDRAWLAEDFKELTPCITGRALRWQGEVEQDGMSFQLAYIYPNDYPARPPLVHVEGGDSSTAIDLTVQLAPEIIRPYRAQLFLLVNRVVRLHPGRADGRTSRRSRTAGGARKPSR